MWAFSRGTNVAQTLLSVLRNDQQQWSKKNDLAEPIRECHSNQQTCNEWPPIDNQCRGDDACRGQRSRVDRAPETERDPMSREEERSDDRGALVAPAQREAIDQPDRQRRQRDERQRREKDRRARGNAARQKDYGRHHHIRHEQIADVPRRVRQSARAPKRLGQQFDVIAGQEPVVAPRQPELRGGRRGDDRDQRFTHCRSAPETRPRSAPAR